MCCKWTKAWIGPCKNEATPSGYCLEHDNKKCLSCGEQATHDCDETGQFVCGYPLCDDCEHVVFSDGTNGGVGFNQRRLPDGELTKRHVKKTEQIYRPWYAED